MRVSPVTTKGATVVAGPDAHAGILRADAHGKKVGTGRAANGGPRAVRWRTVLVADSEKGAAAAGAAAAEAAASKNPYMAVALVLRDLRMWLLSYELVLIPLRFSLTGMVIGDMVCTVLDIFVDITEILMNETLAVRANLPVLQAVQNGLPPPTAADDDYDGPSSTSYSSLRMGMDIATIALLHCGRAVYFLFGYEQLFTYSQFVRVRRVFDLSAHVQALNSDLATNVRFLSSFKFALVLLSVPHWCACLWICATSWGVMGTGHVELPSWPAQLQSATGNVEYDPNTQTYGERYLSATFMAYSGLAALGYEVMLTRVDEVILALAISVAQIVFFAFVLGTLFNYLVRTDENTVAFKALLKAVDEFALDRKLPAPLVSRITAHFRFQHSKQSSATDRIFAQMPKTLQTEVASAQYAREMQATWVFNSCTPQFLSAIVLQLRERYMPPRELLFKRGDGALELLWCVGGTLHVKKGDVLVSSIRADIGPGQIVGELAFFAGIPQPYTVLASPQGEVTLVVLPGLGWDEIVASYPEQLETIMQTVLRKYGLNPNGTDFGAGGVLAEAASRDKEEEEEFVELRESVRNVIIERNEERLAQMNAAVQTGDVETIRALCTAGFDANMGDYDKRTALHVAAAVGHVAVVNLLIELGADCNIPDRWVNTPIRVAIDMRHAAVVEALLAKNATLSYVNPSARLHAAVRSSDMLYLQMLIGAGLDVNAADHDLRTGLHFAAAEGNVRVAEYLIGALADVNARDRWGNVPLDEAFDNEQMVVTQLLLRSSARPDKRKLAFKLRKAAMRAETGVLQFLLEMGVSPNELASAAPHYDGRTSLHYAALTGSASTVSLLLGALIDVAHEDGWGRPPLIDGLQTSDEIGALLVRAGAKLPAQFARDKKLSEAYARAKELDVYPIIRAIGQKLRLAQTQRARANSISRELEVSCSAIAEELSGLMKARRALIRTLERHAPVWIATYGDDDQYEHSDSDLSDLSDADSDRSDETFASADAPRRALQPGADGEVGEGCRSRALSTTSVDTAAVEADGASTDAAVRHIMRLVLNLPKVEAGLSQLRALFERKLAIGPRLSLADSARRTEEHATMMAMLLGEFGLSQPQADGVMAEIYLALARLLLVPQAAGGGARAQSEGAAGGAAAANADPAGDAPSTAHLLVSTEDDTHLHEPPQIMPQHTKSSEAGDSPLEPPGPTTRFTASPAACALLRNGGPFALLAFCGAVRQEMRMAASTESRRNSRTAQLLKRKGSLPNGAIPNGALSAAGGSVGRGIGALGGSVNGGCGFPRLSTGSASSASGVAARAATAAYVQEEDNTVHGILSSAGLAAAHGPTPLSRGQHGGSIGGSSSATSQRVPVYLSDLGWAVLFTSPRFVEIIAERTPAQASMPPQPGATAGARQPPLRALDHQATLVALWTKEGTPGTAKRLVKMLGDRASDRSMRDSQHSVESDRAAAATESVAATAGSGAAHAAEAAPAPSPVERPERPARPSRKVLFGGASEPSSPSTKSLFRSRLTNAVSRKTPEGSHRYGGGAGAGTTAPPNSEWAQEGEQLREAAVMICSFFNAFDVHENGVIDLRTLRKAQALMGGGGRQAHGKNGGKGGKDGSTDVGGSGEIRSLYSTLSRAARALALAAPDLYDEHAAREAQAGQPSAKAKRGLPLGKLQYMVGVSAWVASTLPDDADTELNEPSSKGAKSGSARGERAAGITDVGLHLSSLADLPRGAAHAGVLAEAKPEADSAAALEQMHAALREAFGTQGALDALAASIEQRILQGRVAPDALPTAFDVLTVAHHALTIPDNCRPHALATFFERELAIELSNVAPAAAPEASRVSETALSWHGLVRALHEQGRFAGERKVLASVGAEATSGAAASAGGAGGGAPHGSAELLSKPWFIISVSSKTQRRLHAVFVAVATVDCLLIPLILTFLEYASRIPSTRPLTLAFDATYWFYILLRFNTSFINSKSVEVTEPRECRAAYLAGNFALDVLAALPLNLAGLSAASSQLLFYQFRLIRLVNARYCWRAYQAWKRTISDGSLISGVISVVGVLGIMMHLLACLLQAFANPPIAMTGTPNWATAYNERRAVINAPMLDAKTTPMGQLIDNYITCIFFVMQLITTMGTNQLPVNQGEMGFYLIVLLLNLTVYAWVVGQLSTIVMRQDDEVVSKRAQLELVNGYIASIRVPKELKGRLTKLFRERLKSTSLSSVSAEVIYQRLPMELQIEVASHTYRAVVEATALLRGCSQSFIDRLSSLLTERTLDAETVIFQTGEACNELVFVGFGALQLYDDPQPGESELNIVSTLGVGGTLDDIAFIANIRHVSNARTAPDGETKLFVLTRRAWRELLKTFPGQEDIIMENAISAHDSGSGGGNMTARSGKSGRSAQSRGESGITGSGQSVMQSESEDRLQAVVLAAKQKRAELYHARLCSACARGELDEVKRLLKGTAIDVNTLGPSNRTALHLGACGGNVHVIKLLITARANVNATDSYGLTPLADALTAKQMDAAMLIAKHGGSRGATADMALKLCDSARRPHDGVTRLRALSAFGGDLNTATPQRRTAMHIAAADGKIDALNFLLESGADVNVRDNAGVTPLQDALHARHDVCIDALLKCNAMLGKLDHATELNNAVFKNDSAHLARLMRCGCDVNSADDFGRTPLHVAVSRKRISAVHYLLEQEDIQVNMEDVYGHTPLDDAQRVEAGADTKVLTTLLRAAGGKAGSGKARTHVQAFRDGQVEEKRLAQWGALLESRERRLRDVRGLEAWVREQAAAVHEMRALVDASIAREKEQGAVLADKMPELFEALQDFGDAQRVQAMAARRAREMAEAWAEMEEGGNTSGRSDSKELVAGNSRVFRDVLYKKLDELVLVHEAEEASAANMLVRLQQTIFRLPAARLLQDEATGAPAEAREKASAAGYAREEQRMEQVVGPAPALPSAAPTSDEAGAQAPRGDKNEERSSFP